MPKFKQAGSLGQMFQTQEFFSWLSANKEILVLSGSRNLVFNNICGPCALGLNPLCFHLKYSGNLATKYADERLIAAMISLQNFEAKRNPTGLSSLFS